MSTYTPIASLTLSSATGGLSTPITFSSIPQGYTDLIIVANGLVTGGASTYLRFNGDTGNNYSITNMRGNGSATSSGRTTSVDVATWSVWRTTGIQYGIIQLQNYSNSATYKTFLSRSYDNDPFVYTYMGSWRNTSPITSIQIVCDTTFTAGTTFSIYGIQVGDKSQKAQGGNIVASDGTYMYHAFTSSGSFIPNEALTADVLVVAGGGGGGGGNYHGGGGGAGGYLTFSSQSFTAQSYPCIVGAGGAGGVGANMGTTGSDSKLGSLTLVKGGGGGGYANFGFYNAANSDGRTGGSGGGAAGISNPATGSTATGGSATSGQGFAGGSITYASSQIVYPGGGGGGAGGVGQSSTSSAVCNGGIGAFTAISGGATTGMGVLSGGNYYFAGGGGGSRYSAGTAGTGGLGGGGNGGDETTTNATSGLVNTGGGGGGAERYTTATGGAGGSGIVIIRYAI
jgi:hypothetical protein